MHRWRRPRKQKKIFHSPIVMVVMVIIVACTVVGSIGLYQKERLLSEELAKRVLIQEGHQAAYEEIAAEVAYIESDRGKEEAFRTQFDVVRAGEELVVVDIGDVGLAEPSDRTATTTATSTQPWYRHILFWR